MPNRLDSLIFLRAIAVIMVCLCHFGDPLSEGHALSTAFNLFDKYGKYGVEAFFVISGFVIPLSLDRGHYNLNNYPRFLAKRIIRLHPPYLLALSFTVAISYLSYKHRGLPYPENISTVIRSAFYMHAPADNPVFWTLFVEAQYYIFIGLAFLVFRNYKLLTSFLVVPLLLLLTRVDTGPATIFYYMVFFLIGCFGLFLYNGTYQKKWSIALLSGIIAFTFYFYDLPSSITAVLTLVVIMLYNKPVPKPLAFIGAISYSIYLIHFPLGVKLINVMKRYFSSDYYPLLMFVSLVVVTAVSWAFYKVIEERSEDWSRRVKYKTF
ncbi:acyltransferase [Pedobacter sp. SYSU D00535]|uniref:acyltransferase family protein n=1 Tax=Pedobacter sp. SYSU D00535 TaxID=2810308 RepID=UPI001A97B001|nr:acyltransferase [Pedobacter sp. SYSU D00535]